MPSAGTHFLSFGVKGEPGMEPPHLMYDPVPHLLYTYMMYAGDGPGDAGDDAGDDGAGGAEAEWQERGGQEAEHQVGAV